MLKNILRLSWRLDNILSLMTKTFAYFSQKSGLKANCGRRSLCQMPEKREPGRDINLDSQSSWE